MFSFPCLVGRRQGGGPPQLTATLSVTTATTGTCSNATPGLPLMPRPVLRPCQCCSHLKLHPAQPTGVVVPSSVVPSSCTKASPAPAEPTGMCTEQLSSPGSWFPISVSMSYPTMPRSMSPYSSLRTTSLARCACQQPRRSMGREEAQDSKPTWHQTSTPPCLHPAATWSQTSPPAAATHACDPGHPAVPGHPPAPSCTHLEPDLHPRQLRDLRDVLPGVWLHDRQLAVLEQLQRVVGHAALGGDAQPDGVSCRQLPRLLDCRVVDAREREGREGGGREGQGVGWGRWVEVCSGWTGGRAGGCAYGSAINGAGGKPAACICPLPTLTRRASGVVQAACHLHSPAPSPLQGRRCCLAASADCCAAAKSACGCHCRRLQPGAPLGCERFHASSA